MTDVHALVGARPEPSAAQPGFVVEMAPCMLPDKGIGCISEKVWPFVERTPRLADGLSLLLGQRRKVAGQWVKVVLREGCVSDFGDESVGDVHTTFH